MKILLGHTASQESFGKIWIEEWLFRLRQEGFNVHPYSLIFNNNKPVSYFKDLDMLWKSHDRDLLNLYSNLSKELENYDAFICFNGANIHPEFISQINSITAFGCFDDPEVSHKLSEPVAKYFDLSLVGNIAELDRYKSWGVKNVTWWPLGFRETDYDKSLDQEAIFKKDRNQDITLLCEKISGYRRNKLDKYVNAFPQGSYYGKGWPKGYLDESKRISLLQDTKIGINIHNSTGPINFRTFYLPANGIMQICDNKSWLSKIFKIDDEVIGYDSIEEAIDMTHYYLAHNEDRLRIATNGWKRVLKDYNEVECFKIAVNAIQVFKNSHQEISKRIPQNVILKKPATPICKKIFFKFYLKLKQAVIDLKLYLKL